MCGGGGDGGCVSDCAAAGIVADGTGSVVFTAFSELRFGGHIMQFTPLVAGHSHGGGGHTHEVMDHPGHFHLREASRLRDYTRRAFTVGVGGPVGSGKTALMLQLCRYF